MRRLPWLVKGPLIALLVGGGFAACAAAGDSDDPQGGSGAQAGSSSMGGSGASGNSGGSGTGLIIQTPDASSGATGGITNECGGTLVAGEGVPVDLFIMLDKSGSMMEVAGLQTRWDAIGAALSGFLNDPSSAGLGVGISYFPAFPPCTSDNDCPGSFCVPAGRCSEYPVEICANPGGKCSPRVLGTCEPLSPSVCNMTDICPASLYALPAVAISPLPGAAATLEASIRGQVPIGKTPTGPALQGAHTYARGWAEAHPTHAVAVVLATDGEPTECTPLDTAGISGIAAGALAGAPSIRTYAVGVFSAADTVAQANLDEVARSGGTGQAFVVNSAGNIADEFSAALAAIRGQALSCDLLIPQPEDGGTLDYMQVNVQFSGDGVPTTGLGYVPNAGACQDALGWHYDVDPAQGTPTKIVACPASCGLFKSAGNPRVQIRIGCATEVIVH